jgi:8-amino-3,8-dideoxy-alpha-D-manno-octulosonate transaminase
VFVDIDESLNINPNDLGRVYDEEVKAIIAVPIIGTPCDMEPIMSFARKHGIHVIEDVAQSCGVQYKGKYQGTIGDVGAFSFQMNKIITAGEGGAIVTRSPGFFERAVRYHDQGSFRDKARYGLDTQDELHAFAGQNYRMSEVTGAIMLEQWGKLDFIVNRMRSHYKKIREALAREIPSLKFRKSPDEEGNLGSNLGMIMPDAETAKQFSEALNAENINSFTLYSGKPVYKQPQLFYQRTVEKDNFPYNYPFKKPVIYKEGLCPAAEDLLPRTIFVSLSPILADSDVTEIIEGIVKVYKGLHVEELTEKLQAE